MLWYIHKARNESPCFIVFNVCDSSLQGYKKMFTYNIDNKKNVSLVADKAGYNARDFKKLFSNMQKADVKAKEAYVSFFINLFMLAKDKSIKEAISMLNVAGIKEKSHVSEYRRLLTFFIDNNYTSENVLLITLANNKSLCLSLARGGNVHLNGNVIEKNERSASHVRKTQKASEASEASEASKASEASEASERPALTSFNVKNQLDVLIKSLLSQQARYVVMEALKQATQTLAEEIAKNEVKSKKQEKRAA